MLQEKLIQTSSALTFLNSLSTFHDKSSCLSPCGMEHRAPPALTPGIDVGSTTPAPLIPSTLTAGLPTCENTESNHHVRLITQNRVHSSLLDPWNSVPTKRGNTVRRGGSSSGGRGAASTCCRALASARLKGPHFLRRSVHLQDGLQVRPDGQKDTDADTHRRSCSEAGPSRLLRKQGGLCPLGTPSGFPPLPSGSLMPGRPNRMVHTHHVGGAQPSLT